MELRSSFGIEVNAIFCQKADTTVMYSDEGVQVISKSNKVERRDSIPRAPEGCPLQFDISERRLGMFAVCEDCVYGSFDAKGGIQY